MKRGETIQFINRQDGWIIDVPILESGKFAYSLEDFSLSKDVVKNIVTQFFAGLDYRTLCNLKK